jgi:hypothetical protein
LVAVEIVLGFGFSRVVRRRCFSSLLLRSVAPPSVTSLPKKSHHRSVLFAAPEAFSRVVRRRPSGLGFRCRGSLLLALVSAPPPLFVPDSVRPQARCARVCLSRRARRVAGVSISLCRVSVLGVFGLARRAACLDLSFRQVSPVGALSECRLLSESSPPPFDLHSPVFFLCAAREQKRLWIWIFTV